MKAKDLIRRGESAVAIFTDGTHYKPKSDGTGTTGYWVISARRKVDKVIIYLRGETSDDNVIFLGNYEHVVPSPDKGRNIVRFSGLQQVGTTTLNWHEFANTGTNPIRYLDKIR
jgi:hypothetical protein